MAIRAATALGGGVTRSSQPATRRPAAFVAPSRVATRLRITAIAAGTTKSPAPDASEATTFWAACSAMPVRTEPVRRRIQHRTMPSTVNGTSTPETPCSPAHTSDETIAAGQNPNLLHRPESRKPRIDTSSIHGAMTIAIHASRSTNAVWRCASGTSVVPWKPTERPSRVRSGETSTRKPICASTAVPTARDGARPMHRRRRVAVREGQGRGQPDGAEAEDAGDATIATRVAASARPPISASRYAATVDARYSTAHAIAPITSMFERPPRPARRRGLRPAAPCSHHTRQAAQARARAGA